VLRDLTAPHELGSVPAAAPLLPVAALYSPSIPPRLCAFRGCEVTTLYNAASCSISSFHCGLAYSFLASTRRRAHCRLAWRPGSRSAATHAALCPARSSTTAI